MELDRGLGNTLLREERGYLCPLVTLELDDLAHLLVVNEGAVTSELLGTMVRQRMESRDDQDMPTFLNAFKSFFASMSVD